jgi:hypothetical protein
VNEKILSEAVRFGIPLIINAFLNNLTNYHLDRKSFMCVNLKDIVHTQQCAKDMSINSVYKENAT